MRVNNILILVVAIVLGGLAAFLARNWLLSRSQQAERTTTIIAAAKQLPYGTTLTRDNVVALPWAAKVVPPGSFSSAEALFKEGQRATLATIQPNEPILASKITGPGQRATLSTLLEADKRAITIRVDDVRGVAGFINPGDRVDVVLNRIAQDSQRRFSDLLLQDVKVIAIDQISSEQKDRPVVAKAVTLEVTPYQAQKISLATNVGQLSLILRKAGDSAVVADRRVSEADLAESEAVARGVLPTPAPAPAAAPAKIEPAPERPSFADVTIIRNLKSQDYKVIREVR